jgi:hypothetical protein
VRTVQRFSRHAKVETVMLYDDARRDGAGEVARLVAGLVGQDFGNDSMKELKDGNNAGENPRKPFGGDPSPFNESSEDPESPSTHSPLL